MIALPEWHAPCLEEGVPPRKTGLALTSFRPAPRT
jgi:hypothetical protein